MVILMIEPLPPVPPSPPLSVYYENRISDEKLKRTISITATPHLIYNRNGELIKVPDQSWGIAKDM
jgi:hypothetical protein|tara:strand:- start:281 stop:478 length:198 start_codon:yes stop_codon:yes gene_type:complete